MKAALYVRVSTQEQVENYSIDSQKERLKAYCTAKGWEIRDVYVDPGYSGSNMERPGLKQLLSEVNEFDAVVVYKLDRLSRSQRDTLTLIEEHFLSNKVEFVSITETLDTSTPFGKAMIGILSVFAQLERETIQERMEMGRVKRAEAGLRINGGNYDPAGYLRTEEGLEIKPNEAEHIRKTFELYEKYHSITKVQKHLKDLDFPVWRFRRYNDILMNSLYIGKIKHAGKEYDGVHEPIIDPDQFKRVQVLRGRHKGKNAHRAKEALLAGLIRCGKCGEPYMNVIKYDNLKKDGKSVGKIQYRYLTCRARRFPSEYPEKCFNKTWRSDVIEAYIIERLKGLEYDNEIDQKPKAMFSFDKQLVQLTKKMERLIKLYTEDRIDHELLDKQLDLIDVEKKEILERKAEHESAEDSKFTKSNIDSYVHDLQYSPFEKRQAIVNNLIECIEFYDDKFEVTWRI